MPYLNFLFKAWDITTKKMLQKYLYKLFSDCMRSDNHRALTRFITSFFLKQGSISAIRLGQDINILTKFGEDSSLQ